MCYKPLRIVSNKKDFDSRFDKVFFEVPCGKCCECHSSNVLSWTTRNYYEYIYCKSIGGTVFNFTLTYNDNCLPKKFDIPVFCKSDVQKFLKLLRKWLIKDGILVKSQLRYFLTSEYGHLHQRPHYHIIFYVLKPINAFLFYKYVCKYWKRGFVGYGSLGMEVKDFHALQYACKYITKDSSYSSVVESVKLKYDELSDNKDMIHFDDFFKDFRQFHLQSMSFGSCMLDYLSEDELNLGCIVSPFTDDKSKTIPIPFYIQRKIFYDTVKQDDGTYRYVLNKRGCLRKLEQLNNKIISDEKKLLQFSQLPDDIDLLNELHEDSVSSFFIHLNKMLNFLELPLYSIFVYKYVYRDRQVYDISDNYHIDYSKYLFRFSDIKFDDDVPDMLKVYNSSEVSSHFVCNYDYIFRIFERFLLKFDCFQRYLSYHRELKRVQDYNIKQQQVALQRGSVPVFKSLPEKSEFFTYLSN